MYLFIKAANETERIHAEEIQEVHERYLGAHTCHRCQPQKPVTSTTSQPDLNPDVQNMYG